MTLKISYIVGLYIIPLIGDNYIDNSYCIPCYASFYADFIATTLVMRVVLLFQEACGSAESLKHLSECEVNDR